MFSSFFIHDQKKNLTTRIISIVFPLFFFFTKYLVMIFISFYKLIKSFSLIIIIIIIIKGCFTISWIRFQMKIERKVTDGSKILFFYSNVPVVLSISYLPNDLYELLLVLFAFFHRRYDIENTIPLSVIFLQFF
jgi:hypothetical protein